MNFRDVIKWCLTLEDLSNSVGELLQLGLVFVEEVLDDGGEVGDEVNDSLHGLLDHGRYVRVELLQLALQL